MDDGANIYKLVGPILLKQDTSEAKSTVDGRLEFIDKEMCVTLFYAKWRSLTVQQPH